jgi:stearoyl-CoA desaturase (delta-9 desaturase)
VISNTYHEKVLGRVGDLVRFPELVWLNQFYVLPNIAFLVLLYMGAGKVALVYGGLASIVVTWHLAFSVTVLFHRTGEGTYETYDDSKNSFLLGLLTFGEGWHNNHHANMSSARIGHEPWQVDLGYLVLAAFQRVGLVWDLNSSVGARTRGVSNKIAGERACCRASTMEVEAPELGASVLRGSSGGATVDAVHWR